MRLTKLELQGFKSFADSTEMVFNPGVTAIVGPNGCGKSNVSDAVRWVLGEQRARLLRGAKMEEVIFQGSSARRAVNVAEVSLHFSNEDGTLPVPFQEVVITRRLSRSGESDYFLNRAPCRLRDISDLLRGTGLGADTGVVIESKMIDALLSDRPDDRRELFEEAAGVGLYRDRRRTTERRLEETTVDLQRLDDLITEVQSQVRSLARQRKRAERYAELNDAAVHASSSRSPSARWKRGTMSCSVSTTRVHELRETAAAASRQTVRDAEQARDAAHGCARRRRGAAHGAAASRVARSASRCSRSAARWRSPRSGSVTRSRAASAPSSKRMRARRTAVAIVDRSRAGRRPSARSSRSSSPRARQTLARAAAGRRTRRDRPSRRCARRARGRRERAAPRAAGPRAPRGDRPRARRATRATSSSQRVEQLDARAGAARSTRWRRSSASSRAPASRWKKRASRRGSGSAALEAARAADRETREREAAARAELFRADEAHTSLQGKVNALDALERERVGLAPAAARLLREREQFGEGARPRPVERLHRRRPGVGAARRAVPRRHGARGARARSARSRMRCGRGTPTANPGPLLLLPLDALREDDTAMTPARSAVAPRRSRRVRDAHGFAPCSVTRTRRRRHGLRRLRAAPYGFPARTAGPGPLRRRAELFALRAELTATEQARQDAMAAADATARRGRRSRSAVCSRRLGVARGRRRSTRGAPPSSRVSSSAAAQRAEREVQEADALAERSSDRRNGLTEQVDEARRRRPRDHRVVGPRAPRLQRARAKS